MVGVLDPTSIKSDGSDVEATTGTKANTSKYKIHILLGNKGIHRVVPGDT